MFNGFFKPRVRYIYNPIQKTTMKVILDNYENRYIIDVDGTIKDFYVSISEEEQFIELTKDQYTILKNLEKNTTQQIKTYQDIIERITSIKQNLVIKTNALEIRVDGLEKLLLKVLDKNEEV